MRVTFASGQTAILSDLQRAHSELLQRQREVSSGRRLNVASDDPSGMAASIRGQAEIATVNQYVRSADAVTSRLTVVDTVLSDVISKLSSARSSVVAGLGTVPTAEQREATAREIEGLRDGVFDDLNSTFRGTYLFSGGLGLRAPFVRAADGTISAYQGDSLPISVDIDRTRHMQVSFDGGELTQSGGAEDLFAAFQSVATAVRAGDQAAMTAGLRKLEGAFDRFVREQSGVGADLNALDDQRTRLQEKKQSTEARLSKDTDANIAESITAMKQADTAYQAALGAIATRSRLSLLDYLK